MLSIIVAFLVMLNPFAIFLYLVPIMKELNHKEFVVVMMKAAIISFFVFLVFLFGGEALFVRVFQISFDAFRIFGGIVIFSYAYLFIVKGNKAMIHIREDLNDLASEIALPFMVGAGTISITILMAHELPIWQGVLSLVIVLLADVLSILGLKLFKDRLPSKKLKIAFDKNMEVLLRLNGFILGGIGVDMIINGINNIYF